MPFLSEIYPLYDKRVNIVLNPKKVEMVYFPYI